jgi:hypothetical protein
MYGTVRETLVLMQYDSGRDRGTGEGHEPQKKVKLRRYGVPDANTKIETKKGRK